VPPEALAIALATNVVTGEELAEDAAVGETADPITPPGELCDFESPAPRALIAIPNVNPGSGGQG
jgi:hypothetical protein